MVDVVEVVGVVEEYLGDDVFGVCIDFGFGVVYVGVDVWCFEVFFGIVCNVDVEVCWVGV